MAPGEDGALESMIRWGDEVWPRARVLQRMLYAIISQKHRERFEEQLELEASTQAELATPLHRDLRRQ